MRDNRSITGRYIGLFLFGCFLFSYPVLTIFNLSGVIFGIPLFFFYIFTAWSGLIVFILFCGKIREPSHLPESSLPSERGLFKNNLTK
jgi:hypothetical protein